MGDYTVYFENSSMPIVWQSSTKTVFVQFGKESSHVTEIKGYRFALGVFLLLAAFFSRAPFNILSMVVGGVVIYKSIRQLSGTQLIGKVLGGDQGVEFVNKISENGEKIVKTLDDVVDKIDAGLSKFLNKFTKKK